MNESALYAIALSCLRGVSQAQSLNLMRHFGQADILFQHPDDALSEVQPSVRQRLAEALKAGGEEALALARREVDFCRQHDIAILPYGTALYPPRLAECPDAPVVLFYRGTVQLNAPRVLSVVGTRRITPYGKDVCAELCATLARLLPDTLVVSGLAYGVDIHVHRGCLAHGLPTVGVLAHGLDRIYPATHRDTASQMCGNGGLVTEYVTRTVPDKYNFVRRNRIVAGLADTTLVVESAAKGGALITARLADSYNRMVFAVPGRLTDEYSEGCNRLISTQAAQAVSSPMDLLEQMGWASPAGNGEKAVQLELFSRDADVADPGQKRIVDALRGTDGLQDSQICIRANMPINEVKATLFALEMAGMVARQPGGVYRLLPAAKG